MGPVTPNRLAKNSCLLKTGIGPSRLFASFAVQLHGYGSDVGARQAAENLVEPRAGLAGAELRGRFVDDDTAL